MGNTSDPWTYQCGKCGREFKTAQERDQHMISCGNSPKPKARINDDDIVFGGDAVFGLIGDGARQTRLRRRDSDGQPVWN